jgi:hypothetical protein
MSVGLKYRVVCVVAFALGSAQVVAADAPPRFDAAGFGRLPVWFNGRVTTLEAVAANTLARVSGTRDWTWSDGRMLSPADWMLLLAAGDDRWQDARLLPVEHPATAELLGLPWNEGDPQSRSCSVHTAVDRLAILQARLESLPQSEQQTAADRACLRLFVRLRELGDLMTVMRLPDTSDAQVMLLEAERASQLQSQPIPRLLPPRHAGGEWEVLQFGVLVLQAGGELTPNPAAEHWLRLMLAVKEEDEPAFDQALSAYEAHLKDRGARDCPYEFRVPAGWTEIGVPLAREAAFFSDVLCFGNTVTSLELKGEGGSALVRVNHFSQPTASAGRIIDDWRISEGLAPSAEAERDAAKVTVCGRPGWRVDLAAPAALTGRDEALAGVSFVNGSQTWVVTLTGPDAAVDRGRAGFDEFLSSLQLGEEAALADWFRYDSQQSPGPDRDFTMLTAVVPAPGSVWVLQSAVTADQSPEDRLAELRAWMQSLAKSPQTAASGKPPFTSMLPVEWSDLEPPQGDAVLQTQTPAGPVWWTLRPLETTSSFDILRLVNHWRTGTRLPPLTQAEAATVVTPVDTPLGQGWLVKYVVPQAP